MTKLDVTFVSLFPESTRSIVQSSILGRALKNDLITVHETQIRDYAQDKHKTVDDSPCGGGPGQLMRVDVVSRAIQSASAEPLAAGRKVRVVMPDPAGRLFTQQDAQRLAEYDHLVFVCGRYEGIDSRIYAYVDEALSIGDYVITGGELASLVMLDAIARHVPGVLGNESSQSDDSHQDGVLEPSQYTRPIEFYGRSVPEVLLSGNHQLIQDARRGERLLRTEHVRPDLFAKITLTGSDAKLMQRARESGPYPWQK
jgi:tRNA (guanine37-N1)-methyltransferase